MERRASVAGSLIIIGMFLLCAGGDVAFGHVGLGIAIAVDAIFLVVLAGMAAGAPNP